jgi:hypothetical protein
MVTSTAVLVSGSVSPWSVGSAVGSELDGVGLRVVGMLGLAVGTAVDAAWVGECL